MNHYFAVVGDVHGHMNRMVAMLETWQVSRGILLDFVLQVGDFEPHRTLNDLDGMSCPAKYRELGDFHHYYAGHQYFPWPLYFIGGNHEPYGWLETQPAGFELMPHCHYLGRAGWVEINGCAIAGLSGIYHPDYFACSRPDVHDMPSVSKKRYTYFNEADVQAIKTHPHMDILLLHDWPSGCAEDEVSSRQQPASRIGNVIARYLVNTLKPSLVCCGHMHRHHRMTLSHRDGKKTHMVGLNAVPSGRESFAVFRYANGFEEVT